MNRKKEFSSSFVALYGLWFYQHAGTKGANKKNGVTTKKK